MLLVAAPAVAFKIAGLRRGSVPVAFEEHLTAAPIERTEHHVSRVALPSQWTDYDFLISATIRWYALNASGPGRVLNPAGLAVEAVLDRARAITEQREPGRVSLVQHELSGALSSLLPDRARLLAGDADDTQATREVEDRWRADLYRLLQTDSVTVDDLYGVLSSLQQLVNTSAARPVPVHNAISGGVQHGPVIQSGRITGLTFHVHGPGLPVQD